MTSSYGGPCPCQKVWLRKFLRKKPPVESPDATTQTLLGRMTGFVTQQPGGRCEFNFDNRMSAEDVAARLAVTVAEKVAGLPKAEREQVAAQIRAGADPAGAVRKHASPARTKHKKPKDALGAFLRWLERGVPDLEGRVDKVWIDLRAEQMALLGRAEAVIGVIRQHALATAEADSHTRTR